MSGIISSMKHRAFARFRNRAKRVPFAWRVVEQGPLLGATVYVPENSYWGNDVVNGVYEPEFISVLQDQARQGGCLYDVGGHVGIFSLAWLKMGGGFVETFEPLLENSYLITEVLKRNQLQNECRVHQLGLGDFSAEGTLVEHKYDSSRSQIAELDKIALNGNALNVNQRAHSIWVTQLDVLFEHASLQPPSIMKIDVEGAEYNVLAGGANVLRKYRPIILTEIHTARSALKVARLLISMDYELKFLGAKGNMQTLPLCQWIPRK